MKRRLSILCALLSLLFICPQSSAQTADPDLQRALTRADLGIDQNAALEHGEPVIKVMPSNDRREVAVCGVIKLPSNPETTLEAFQLTLTQLKQKSNLQFGKFSNPPRVEDLESLTLSDSDIVDLKTCTVGDCNLRLSAAMIQRFQKSIDWNAIGYENQLNQLFRLMIVEYVTDYLQRGDAALIEYADRSTRVPLAREQESLLANLLYINDAAPDFVRHVKAFPRSSVPAEHYLSWARIDFGFKPVLVISDVTTYRSEVAGVQRVLVLSKQIYAQHYFDASLSLTAMIGDHTQRTSTLLYQNHSRASALASVLSRFKHEIVERRATGDLKDLLQQTSLNVDAILNNSSPSFEPTLIQRIRESSALQIFPLSALLILIGILLYVTFHPKIPRIRKE